MRRSPLHGLNTELGARFTDFGGWEMPVQYQSVLAEHRSVRGGAGVFDVTHLGRFELTGPGSRDALRHLLCNDIDRIEPGRCQYTMLLNESGGIVDDLIVWWWSADRYWVMPNAANHDRVLAAFTGQPGCTTVDLQAHTVFLAVQGPEAPELLEQVLGSAPRRFRCVETSWDGVPVAMAGTGYTGESGAELCIDADGGEGLMRSLIAAGADPCGLGARDTLRLESGLPLWGMDIDETTTPLEAGLDFAVSYGADFIGKDVLLEQREHGVSRLLCGFVLEGKGIPRHGYEAVTSGGSTGVVTSGNLSPVLETGVGLAYLGPPPNQDETVEVTIRDRRVAGRLAQPPFHRS
ncbi:MAG TPA: glycine cleavage system aminomethyltransferase GcvT [Acidimicrobiia bacterium]